MEQLTVLDSDKLRIDIMTRVKSNQYPLIVAKHIESDVYNVVYFPIITMNTLYSELLNRDINIHNALSKEEVNPQDKKITVYYNMLEFYRQLQSDFIGLKSAVLSNDGEYTSFIHLSKAIHIFDMLAFSSLYDIVYVDSELRKFLTSYKDAVTKCAIINIAYTLRASLSVCLFNSMAGKSNQRVKRLAAEHSLNLMFQYRALQRNYREEFSDCLITSEKSVLLEAIRVANDFSSFGKVHYNFLNETVVLTEPFLSQGSTQKELTDGLNSLLFNYFTQHLT